MAPQATPRPAYIVADDHCCDPEAPQPQSSGIGGGMGPLTRGLHHMHLSEDPEVVLESRLVKYGSVHYTDTRIYARIYAVHGELGCCVRISRQYTKSVHGSREPAGNFDLCS